MADDLHQGLPVSGYLPQSADKVAIVNNNKELEERCLRAIEAIMADGRFSQPLVAQARNNIEQGFMWLNRAVFMPSRVSLPEDVH